MVAVPVLPTTRKQRIVNTTASETIHTRTVELEIKRLDFE